MNFNNTENYEHLTQEDYDLIKIAENIIKDGYNLQYGNKVSSAILTTNKKIFKGISIKTGTVNYCAEAGALSSMFIDNSDNKIQTIVACRGKTNPPCVISPCGVCRELLLTSFPNAHAIIKVNEEEYIKIKIKNLLPYPYYSTHVNFIKEN